MGKISEAARERETFRYDVSLLAESKINDTRDPVDPALLTSCSDTALTAFAQLGALRLGAERCLISLFDQKREHIIAEATRSTSLASNQDDAGHADKLWLSGTAIPRNYAVSDHVLVAEDSRLHPADLPISFVPNLTADPRFDDQPYARNSKARFYAGVPIRSPRGINIGVYSVFGDETRDSLDSVSIRFLQDISRTVMIYLQRKLSDRIFRRNARMVGGLGSLFEGKSSMSRPQLSSSAAIDPSGTAHSLNPTEEFIQRRVAEEDDEEEERVQQEQLDRVAAGPDLHDRSPTSTTPAPPGVAESAFSESELGYRGSSIGNMSLPSLGGATSSATTLTTVDESVIEIQALFSGAAEIIRESIEVDGVLFLDAAIGSFGGLVADPSMEGRSSDDSQVSQASGNEEGNQSEPPENTVTFCKVLGLSVSDAAELDPGMAALPHRAVPEKFLKSMLRRYAGGHTFTFDDSGAIQSADSSEEDGATTAVLPNNATQGQAGVRRRQPRRSDGDVLLGICPKARNVVLVPLWDSHKERWFAGSFIWTRTPNRVFTKSEVGYLAAFGTAMMANVARIEMMRADRGKTDVLGSLSHELRTPIHGIILGTELLRDTRLNAFQEDVLHTVEMCGRTLVQTMEHLLDFSKINRFTKKSRKRRIAGGGTRDLDFKSEITSLVSDIDLDSLVEEVIESVFAGFSFQQTVSSREYGKNRLYSLQSLYRIGEDVPRRPGPAVSVYLNIDPTLSWKFRAQPGAIRRIIMNIFGNALKYTSQGTIYISLTQDRAFETKKTRRRNVVFTVSDTGKGINQDYLRNRLFTPFAQEDQLASGVGLGLSLVKQITSSLKGSIGVDSRVGNGTSVRIVLPLSQSISSPPETAEPAEMTDFLSQVKPLKGLGVRLVGFSTLDEDIGSSRTERHSSPMALMERVCQYWLQLTIISAAEAETTSTAFHLCTEEGLEELRTQQVAHEPPKRMIVVCRDALAAHELAKFYDSHTENIYEFISQPCGPRKLAKVLTLALARQAEPKKSRKERTPSAAQESASPSPDRNVQSALDVIGTEQTSLDGDKVQQMESTGKGGQASNLEKRPAFLLVDDNSINLKILESYMKKSGNQFDTAMNGQEALEAFRRNPQRYRCIFMDISMPIMDGLEATRFIRAFEIEQVLTPPVFIIALTGLASAHTQQEAFASGVNLFLTKPVALKELGRILKENGV